MPWGVIDLLLPERCPACAAPARGLCRRCLTRASSLRLPDGGAVSLAPGVLAVSVFSYQDVVARAVRSVKTPGRHAPARHLGALLWLEMAVRLGPATRWPRTWVPSTPHRRRARGVEVPRLLAGHGAQPMLGRHRHAAAQKTLDARARRVAPVGAFRARGGVPERVVLVDDVRTTGATASAAAGALRAAGARRVLVVTLAAVMRRTGSDGRPPDVTKS